MIFNKLVVSRTGRRIPLQPPTNFAAQAGNAQVTLTWTDPENETSGGTTYATWDYTRVVRKTGSSPADENDGELVVESSQKNQYQTTGFVDDGLVNDTQYFYGAFARSTDGVWSEGVFANATPMAGTPLGNLVEGTLIKIQENGAPVEFYLAKHDYESSLNGAGRTLVVRKDCYDNRVWDNGNVNAYASSDLDSWFNSTYKNMLDADIRSLIGTTKIRYTPGNGNNTVGTLERAVFALSASELGQYASWFNVEGSALPIANTLKVAYLNGSANTQWTRSPYTVTTNHAVYLYSSGNDGYEGCNNSNGSRPTFTLPSTALVDQDLNLIETTPAAQEAAA